MLCSKCGKQMNDGGAFCPGCGMEVSAAPREQSSAGQRSAFTPPIFIPPAARNAGSASAVYQKSAYNFSSIVNLSIVCWLVGNACFIRGKNKFSI